MVDGPEAMEIAADMNKALLVADANIMLRLTDRVDHDLEALRDIVIGLSVSHLHRSYVLLRDVGYDRNEIVDTLTRLLADVSTRRDPHG